MIAPVLAGIARPEAGSGGCSKPQATRRPPPSSLRLSVPAASSHTIGMQTITPALISTARRNDGRGRRTALRSSIPQPASSAMHSRK